MSLTDKEYYNLTVSISKALSNTEMPLKTKHARAAIIGSFHSRGAHSFWAIAIRQPLQENRIVAWKFCHLLHKVLREGHPLCCHHSTRHKAMLGELGKLWGHLTDGYGQCIKEYTKLLVTKLEFHERNPRFPGSMALRRGDLSHMAAGDINVYFQMAVEMFDYIDDILTLQATIFSSITMYRVNSMTPTGQCRLAPLIPLIQDSNHLYDAVVRVMFKLHTHLSSELLSGHRDRFRQMFPKLRKFFQQSSELQYFVNLISIPRIPENPPNFMSRSDFGSYIPPVVVVPEPEPDPVVENLVDTSEPMMQRQEEVPVRSQPPEPDYHELVKQRDELIQHLQFENERLGKHIKLTLMETQEKQLRLEEDISTLNTDLATKQEELTNLRLIKEDLELKVQTAPIIEQKVHVEEERARASEEKFSKLKTMYTQIRDEHVKLLRQHGETTKSLATIKKSAADANNEKESFRAQLQELETETRKIEEVKLQKSAAEQSALTETTQKLNDLLADNAALHMKCEELEANKSAEIAELSIKCDQLKETIKELEEQIKLTKNDRTNLQETHKNEIARKMEEFARAQEDIALKYEEKVTEVSNLKDNLKNLESQHEEEIKVQQLASKTNKEKVEALEGQIKKEQVTSAGELKVLYEMCVTTSEKMALRLASENEIQSMIGTAGYFMLVSKELNEILATIPENYQSYTENRENTSSLIGKIVMAGHLLSSIHGHGITICNNTADIEFGEKIVHEMKGWFVAVKELYQILLRASPRDDVAPQMNSVKSGLQNVTTLIGQLCQKLDSTEQIADMVEAELTEMDKSIEEAAKKFEMLLSQSRAKHSGVKLEVNEKILDACTSLMDCIRVLVQKSRLLQAEIIVLGKGTASVKEFYKRNHQWTEGLISAAKSVAQGANFLVTAANKSVIGDAKHQLDLVVAAQEIAASTAQLVVASRVKAPRGSTNLSALGSASRSVTQATGVVVATAKDNSKTLEESQDADLTKLTVHQAKTFEMELQVKVLELEQALQMERLRLAAFRRKNYQAPAENDK